MEGNTSSKNTSNVDFVTGIQVNRASASSNRQSKGFSKYLNRDIVFDVVNPFPSKRFPIDE